MKAAPTPTTTRLARYEVTNPKEETRLIRRENLPFSGDFSDLIARCVALRTGHLRTNVPAERLHLTCIPARSRGATTISDLLLEFGSREGEAHTVTVELEPGDFVPLLTGIMATPRAYFGLMVTCHLGPAQRRERKGKAA